MKKQYKEFATPEALNLPWIILLATYHMRVSQKSIPVDIVQVAVPKLTVITSEIHPFQKRSPTMSIEIVMIFQSSALPAPFVTDRSIRWNGRPIV